MVIDVDKLTPFLPPVDKLTMWRFLVGISAFSFWVFVGVFFVFIYPNIAQSDSVDELRHEQKEERILEHHRDMCRADQGSQQADYYLRRRNELISEYRRINGEEFDLDKLPPCEMLRVPLQPQAQPTPSV